MATEYLVMGNLATVIKKTDQQFFLFCPNKIIHLFNKYLVHADQMPPTVPNSRDEWWFKGKIPAFWDHAFFWRETDCKPVCNISV